MIWIYLVGWLAVIVVVVAVVVVVVVVVLKLAVPYSPKLSLISNLQYSVRKRLVMVSTTIKQNNL